MAAIATASTPTFNFFNSNSISTTFTKQHRPIFSKATTEDTDELNKLAISHLPKINRKDVYGKV